VRLPHFENDSLADATPAPTVTVNVRDVFCGLSEAENVCVVLVGGGGVVGGVVGAEATTGDAVDMAVVEPPPLVAVTAARRVRPTSAVRIR